MEREKRKPPIRVSARASQSVSRLYFGSRASLCVCVCLCALRVRAPVRAFVCPPLLAWLRMNASEISFAEPTQRLAQQRTSLFHFLMTVCHPVCPASKSNCATCALSPVSCFRLPLRDNAPAWLAAAAAVSLDAN